MPDDIYSNYSSPVKTVDGDFNFSYSDLSSPDIFVRGLDAFSQQSIQCLGPRYEPESHDILHSPAAIEKITNTHVMLEECRSQDFFCENLQLFSPDISFLSQTLAIDSQANLGSVASFITRSHWSLFTVCRILLLVLKWRFKIKKKVATKKSIPQIEILDEEFIGSDRQNRP